MAGTWTRIYIQIVFSVKGRDKVLAMPWREEVFKYMAGIIREKGHKPIIVNGVADHVHIFVGFNSAFSLSDLVRGIKSNSSKFINDNKWVKGKFQWQQGYGAFSYSHSHMPVVYQYILNQEEHHKSRSFEEEYIEFLKRYEIEYQEKYLFDE